jgi:hypothetical protein
VSLLDILMEAANAKSITRNEFAEAMRSGDEKKKQEAIDMMLDAGGYENLEEL